MAAKTLALGLVSPVRLQAGGPGDMPLELFYLAILLMTLVGAGAILLRRWQSRRALEARLVELSALAEVGRAISGAQLDLHRLAALVYQQAGQIVDTSIFQLGLFEGDRYRLLIWVVDGQHRPPLEFRLTPGALGIVGWMRDSRKSLLIRDFETERDSLPAKPRYISADPPRSAVFVPLLVGDEVLGAIAIQSRRPHAFSEEHLRLLSIVASHAAAALQNGRLLEQAQRRATQLQRLSEISQQLNAIQSLPALYRQVVTLAAEKFGDYAVSFFECRSEALVLCATTRPEWQGQAVVFPLGEGLVGQTALARREIVVQELPEYPSDQPEVATPPELAVPVDTGDRVFGVLDVVARAGTVFDDLVVSIFKSLAAQMALAILEGQTYAAERRRSEQLAAIAQASRAVASTLELDDLLDEVLDLVDERFGYERAQIFLLYEDQLVLRASTGGSEARWVKEGRPLPLDGRGLIPLVGRTRKAILVDDVTTHPDYLPGPGLEDTRTEMAAPLVMGPRLLGVFDVQSPEPHALTEDDKQTLQTLSDTLAVAVRNARLFEAERRRRRLAEILREVSAALTSTLHLDDVLDLILDGLARVVSYDAASILLANELGELILRAARGLPAAQAALGRPLEVRLFPPGGSFPPAIPFGEVDERGAYHDLLGLPDPHACLGAVLAVRGEHLGYLVVDRAGRSRFPSEEVELITAFASQAAVAIENARLYTAQREQAWVSTALLQVAEATARAPELVEVFQTVARLTPMLVGVDRCAVLLAEGEAFVLQAYHAADDDFREAWPHRMNPSEWPRFVEMLGTHEPVVLEPEDALPEIFRDLFTGVTILLPLLARGRVEGALVVGQAPGEMPFTTHRIRLLSGIANQAALAIESAMLYRSQQEEAWVSTALLQVAQAVAEQPTLEDALETVARLTPMLVGIDKVAIYHWDEAARLFRPSQVVGLGASTPLQLTVAAGDLGLDGAEQAAPAYPFTLPHPLAQALDTQVGMIWPLRARGDLLGALVVAHAPVEALGRRLSILNGIAHQLSLAMENARLSRDVALQHRLEREMELGRDIQASFLPESCPQIPGWDVSAYWRAARQVGGDFYDFFPLRAQEGEERWGVVIADVADKGVPAALFMALSRTLLRSVGIGRVSPAATLARVNQLILADARTDLFVTVFYGVWEPGTGRLSYAIAGHNPPVWVTQQGEVRTLEGRGIALGVLDEVQYDEHDLHLAPGEVLFLFTDGVTEAVNAVEEEFGLSRLLEVMRGAHTCSAQEIQAKVAAAVHGHVGPVEAFDDMTMVVIKRSV